MRALLLALVAGPATADAGDPGRTAVTENLKVIERLNVPSRLRYALATAIPQNVRILAHEETRGVVKIVGEAKSYDDVSEFMRGLNNVAVCPAGMARVVERHRDGRFRVELMGSGVILDFSRAQVRFFFANLELKSAEVTGKAVRFELWRVNDSGHKTHTFGGFCDPSCRGMSDPPAIPAPNPVEVACEGTRTEVSVDGRAATRRDPKRSGAGVAH